MKTSHALLCSFVVGLIISVSGVSHAQETDSSDATPTTQEKQETQQKKKRPTFMTALEASVSDLTEEQKAGLNTLKEATAAKHKEINQAAGLTWKMSKEREEIFQGLSEKTPHAERAAEASKQAGLNEAQVGAIKDAGQVYRTFRYDAMKLLTAEQQAKMPKWFQDDYAKSVAIAEKEKEAAKEAKTQ